MANGALDLENLPDNVQPSGTPSDDEDARGENVDAPDEESSDIEETPDGGALVTMDDDAPGNSGAEFYVNLVEELPDDVLSEISSELFDLIELDKNSRKKRDAQYAEGLRRTGMGDDAPGGAAFDGASKVTHPMITQAAVDFCARVMKELFPPDGPVRAKVVGQPTSKKLERADRKTDYMNWQLTEQMPEFRSELEQAMTQVPIGGAAYLKIFWSSTMRRPVAETVYVDDVLLPYAASNFITAERRTYVQKITAQTFERRVESGLYFDPELRMAAGGIMPDETESAQVAASIEGKEEDAANQDGLRTVFEVETTLELDGMDDEGPSPYIVTIDDMTRKILAIYRNWEEYDDVRRPMNAAAEFGFLPWRGAYPIGIVHLIGGMAAAATGSLRALLDSAHINNASTLIRLKGVASVSGKSLTPNPGEVLELEGASMSDPDIRKTIMAMPYNPPSQVLFSLLGFLDSAGKSMVQTSFEKLSDSNDAQPVGTTLALIEQGMTVFSSIHARMHAGMAQALKILHRLNKLYMTESEQKDDAGEVLARRSDFDGPMDIVPVSDPNIFSDTQRFAQIQVVAQRAQLFPQLYDLRKVEEMILDRTKIPDAKDLLIAKPEPQHLNAINENVAATLGKPVVAFPEQDHYSHIQTHIEYMVSPAFGMLPIIGMKATPILLTHLSEHLALWYLTQSYNAACDAAGMPVENLLDIKDADVVKGFDVVMAQASSQAILQGNKFFGPESTLPDAIQKCIKFIQGFQPPPPQDPSAVAAKEVDRKAAQDQANNQIAQAKLEVQKAGIAADAQGDAANAQAKMQSDMQIAAERAQVMREDTMERETNENQRKTADLATRERMNEADNDTAKRIAMAELVTGAHTGMENGRGLNPGP